MGSGGVAARKILGAVDLGGVFDDLEVVLLGKLQDRVHVHGMAVDVDRHDGLELAVALLYLRFDFGADLAHVHAPGAGVAVHKDRDAAVVDDRLGAGDDGEGRHDDLVARPEAEAGDGRLEGRGAVAHGDAVFHAAVGGPFLLEFLDETAGGGDPAGAEALRDIFDLALTDKRFVDGDYGHTLSTSKRVLSPSPT